MGKICANLNPNVCLECISGEMVEDMLGFLNPGGTLILYGILSLKPATFNGLTFLSKGLKIEGYMLSLSKLKTQKDLDEFA